MQEPSAAQWSIAQGSAAEGWMLKIERFAKQAKKAEKKAEKKEQSKTTYMDRVEMLLPVWKAMCQKGCSSLEERDAWKIAFQVNGCFLYEKFVEAYAASLFSRERVYKITFMLNGKYQRWVEASSITNYKGALHNKMCSLSEDYKKSFKEKKFWVRQDVFPEGWGDRIGRWANKQYDSLTPQEMDEFDCSRVHEVLSDDLFFETFSHL
jgi:hypothetical protein